MTTTEIAVPEKELREQGSALIAEANAIQITSHDQYEAAGAFLVGVAALRKSITAAMKPVKDATHTAHKAATNLENDLLAGPAKADLIVRTRMSAYSRAEQVAREKAQREQQEALRKQIEDQRITQAQTLADAGHVEIADQILDAPVVVAPVELPKPTAAGVSVRKVVKFRIIDPAKINRAYLVPDETKIRAQVKALGKDAASVVGGIEVYEENELAVRAR